MPDLHTTLWTYPWDLADEGFEDAVRSIEGAGLNGVSLAAAYHSFEMLRPHLKGRVLLQIPRSAVYFRPDASRYTDTPIKPHVSPLMGDADWYAQAAKAASKAGLDLIAWTVFLHNSHQAGQHPDCAEVACTGDVSTARLCPASPAVRAYAVALAADLARYGIALLECESLSYGGFGHTHYHVKHGVELGEGGRFLLSLCFCSACLKAASEAGLDAGAVARSAEKKLREALAAGRPVGAPPAELAGAIPGLDAFVRMREDTVASLLREVRAAAGVPASFILMGAPHSAGLDRERIARIADCVEILSYTADPDRTGAAIAGLLPDLESPGRLVVGLQAYPPASPDAETLRANVRRAVELGVRRLSFYNYGIMPKPNLGWIKTAIEK